MFADVDPTHDWLSLVDSSYEILDKCSASSLGIDSSKYLTPNWCNVTKEGNVVAADNISKDSTDYSFDAMRSLWRIGLDYLWYKDQRAIKYLRNINLLSDEWTKFQKIHTAYTHSGKSVDEGESLVQYGAQFSYFKFIDKKIADTIYKVKIISEIHGDKNGFYWGDKNNYYNQNWVWFRTALYSDNLPNLWELKK